MKIYTCESSKEYVQAAQRRGRCAVVRLLTWKRARFWHASTSIPERVLFVYPHPPSLVVLRPVPLRCVYAVCFGIQNLILFLKAFGQLLRVAELVLVRPMTQSVLWSSFGEDVSAQAQAREAYVQKNGGVEDTSSASAREAPELKNGGESRISQATNEQQSLCHALPGRERDGSELDVQEAGFEEIRETDIMSEGSFASAESQGYRTEEEDTLTTFEVSMIRLGWQNEELI